MLQSAYWYLPAKFGADTAENELSLANILTTFSQILPSICRVAASREHRFDRKATSRGLALDRAVLGAAATIEKFQMPVIISYVPKRFVSVEPGIITHLKSVSFPVFTPTQNKLLKLIFS